MAHDSPDPAPATPRRTESRRHLRRGPTPSGRLRGRRRTPSIRRRSITRPTPGAVSARRPMARLCAATGLGRPVMLSHRMEQVFLVAGKRIDGHTIGRREHPGAKNSKPVTIVVVRRGSSSPRALTSFGNSSVRLSRAKKGPYPRPPVGIYASSRTYPACASDALTGIIHPLRTAYSRTH